LKIERCEARERGTDLKGEARVKAFESRFEKIESDFWRE